jgi:hypothetical protein
VRYVRIIWKLVEVAFNLTKVLWGNWSPAAALILSMVELHTLWRDELAAAQALYVPNAIDALPAGAQGAPGVRLSNPPFLTSHRP